MCQSCFQSGSRRHIQCGSSKFWNFRGFNGVLRVYKWLCDGYIWADGVLMGYVQIFHGRLLGLLVVYCHIYTHILFIDSIASDSIPAFLIEINSWLSSCFSKTWNFVTLYLAITAGKGHNNFSHISCRWLSIHFNRHSIWWFVRCYIVFYPHYILSNSASS